MGEEIGDIIIEESVMGLLLLYTNVNEKTTSEYIE